MIEPHGNKNEHTFYIQTALQKVQEVFYKFPEKEFSLSDLAEEAGVAKANLGQIINLLAKYGFVKLEKLTKIWRIKADQESWFFVKNKIIYNLNFVYQSGILEFIYNTYHHPKSVMLFGSFRKGEDISTPDIDIAVESDEFKEYKILSGLKELESIGKTIGGRKIQIHEFSRKTVDKNLFNNIANGVVLIGFLEVNP